MLSHSFMRFLLFLLALLAGLGGPLPALRAEGKIKVTVLVILATARDKKVDARLKCIAEEVRKKEPELTGFHSDTMICKSVAPNEKAVILVADGPEVVFMVERGADAQNRVQLMVKAPAQGKIVYQTVCGKFMPLVTRYRTKKNGDRLILAIMVRPCQHK